MTFILTTPLYYVNDKAHLGSTYTTIACDALARFHRLEGTDVVFITGVDEHGQKIQRTAESKDITPQAHCDEIAKHYLDLWKSWNISNNRFIRTTNSSHKELVEEFFNRVYEKGDIYMGHQKGWYCVGCEEFKEVKPEEVKPTCPLHLRNLEWRDEENLFFRLSNYQKNIEELVNQKDFIAPFNRKKEIINFVGKGLKDFSISRVNVSWGIPVPKHQGHTFYVWFDALLGYLTASLDDGGSNQLSRLSNVGWPASLHIIGKDILRFHAIYWPAMLISAGLDVPHRVYGHGFLTREGNKMGKSLGNVIDPKILLNNCGNDQIRWYLLRDIQFGQDGDFQIKRFTDLVNNDLANTIGNMVNRTSSMSRKWFNNAVPKLKNSSCESLLSNKTIETVSIVRQNYNNLNFQHASEEILKLAREANIFLNDNAPWKMIKDSTNVDEVGLIIYSALETSRIIGILLMPLVPELSKKILVQLGISEDIVVWHDYLKWGLLKSGQQLPSPEPVIPKIELPDLT